jgi:CheY-like chemotaxis protein
LGLSISKKIVELMNGSIQIKSKLNKGTQFIVTVPFMIEKLQSIEKQTIYVDSNLLKNKIILIADDNEENRLVAKEILLSFNNSIKIMEASDGNEVIKLLFKKIPDILFIDLDMPNLNGIETTQQIRKNKKYDRIKIIGNTASLSTFTYEEFTVLGFDDFIYKPYKAENLIYKIQEVSK